MWGYVQAWCSYVAVLCGRSYGISSTANADRCVTVSVLLQAILCDNVVLSDNVTVKEGALVANNVCTEDMPWRC
jgi:hypothetical protein